MDDESDGLALSRSWFGAAGEEFDASGVAALAVSRAATVDLARVPRALGDGLAEWLGTPDGHDPSGLARYLCDLELWTGPEGRRLFRKAAIVSIGQPVAGDDGWQVRIEWRAASLAPLFPVFSGALAIKPATIALRGTYAPPLGVVGQLLDRAVLSIAARGTARWFLAMVADAVAG
jgi:hypothetical protein